MGNVHELACRMAVACYRHDWSLVRDLHEQMRALLADANGASGKRTILRSVTLPIGGSVFHASATCTPEGGAPVVVVMIPFPSGEAALAFVRAHESREESA